MVGVKLIGVSAAKKAFRLLPQEQKDEHNENTERTLFRIVSIAQAQAPNDRGHLRRAIASKFTKNTGSGIAGIRKTMITIPQQRFMPGQAAKTTTKYTNVYGRMVHDGGLHNPNPVPFMLNAAVAAESFMRDGAKAATARACATVSAGGGRFL